MKFVIILMTSLTVIPEIVYKTSRMILGGRRMQCFGWVGISYNVGISHRIWKNLSIQLWLLLDIVHKTSRMILGSRKIELSWLSKYVKYTIVTIFRSIVWIFLDQSCDYFKTSVWWCSDIIWTSVFISFWNHRQTVIKE